MGKIGWKNFCTKKKVKKISKKFLQKFFSPNLTQLRNAPLSRRNHEKFEKKFHFFPKIRDSRPLTFEPMVEKKFWQKFWCSLGTQQFQFHHQIAKKMTKKFQKKFYAMGAQHILFLKYDILDGPNLSFHAMHHDFMVQKFSFNSLCSRLCILLPWSIIESSNSSLWMMQCHFSWWTCMQWGDPLFTLSSLMMRQRRRCSGHNFLSDPSL